MKGYQFSQWVSHILDKLIADKSNEILVFPLFQRNHIRNLEEKLENHSPINRTALTRIVLGSAQITTFCS